MSVPETVSSGSVEEETYYMGDSIPARMTWLIHSFPRNQQHEASIIDGIMAVSSLASAVEPISTHNPRQEGLSPPGTVR